MSKRTKLLFIGLIIGLVGMAFTIGVAIGTDMIMSREDSETFYFNEPFDTLVLSYTGLPNFKVRVAQGEYKVDAYIKAWRPENIDLDNKLSFDIIDGVLYISLEPFPDDFLGMFPQPLEMIINVYSPLGDDLDVRWE